MIPDATYPTHRRQPRRPVRLRGPGGDAQHPDRRHGLRRHPAGLRGPRPGDRARTGARRSATSSTSRRGSSPAASSTPRARARASRWPRSKPTRGPGDGHFGNFIAAVRSREGRRPQRRRSSRATAPVPSATWRTSPTGSASPSRSIRSTTPSAPTRPSARRSSRMEEHLKDDNGLKLDGMQYRLGRRLRFDGRAERFVDDARANALLTRDYRPPFVVPESLS